MRQFNTKFFLVLVGGFAILAGGLFLLHRFQQDRIARALLWQADHARQENQPEKAAEYYFRYLEFKPDDTATRVAYAELLEQQLEKLPLGARNPRAVVDLYEEVLKKEPARDAVRRKLVALYMLPRARKFDDALSHLDVVQERAPEDGELWQQRAVCEEGMARYDAAVKAFEKAIEFPPDQVRAHEMFARLLRKRLNKNQQADDTIQQMVERHGQSHEAWLARARYRLDYSLGDVAADADKALALAPDNAEAILLVARSRQTGARVPEAIALLERGLKLYPTDARMYRHLAWIEYNLKKPEQARKRLQDGIVACPDAFDLHTALAELLIQGKMFDQVQKIIADLKAKGVREDRLQYLSARVALEREQWTDAALTLEKMRPDARGNPELSIQLNLLLAQSYKQLGDGDRQHQALTRVLEFDANSVLARQAMGTLHAAAGRLDEAVKEYQHLVTLPNAPETAVTDLVRLMVARTQRLPAAQQTWRDAETLFDQIARRGPASVELVLARSDLLAAQKRTREAADLLAKACEKSTEMRLWLQSAHFAEQADGSGLAVLDAAEVALGDRVELRLKRAALLLGRSHAEVARSLPGLEKVPPTFTPEQVAQLRAGLAELYFIVHDYSNAKRLYRGLAADRPSDLAARQMLAEIALREKDADVLPAILADVAKVEPPGGIAHALLDARYLTLLVEAGDRSAADRAREKVGALLLKRPTWPQVHQAAARLADAEEDRPKAIEHYRRAIDLGDLDLHTHQRLVALLVETKQDKAAAEVLQQVAKLGHLSPEQHRRMLQSVSPLLNTTLIRDFATSMVPRGSMDPNDHVWLGKMYWDTGDRTKAVAEFRTALDQAGQVPENWINLVQALVANNQLDEAKKVMADARTKLPSAAVAATLATCLEIARRFDESAAEYAAALKQKPDDPQILRRYVRLLLNIGKNHDAAAFLQTVLSKPGELTKEDLAWVRRNLAIIGTTDRTPEQFAKAFQLLKQNAMEVGDTIDDQRAKVIVLAHMPPTGGGPSPRRQAVDVLEKMLKQPRAGLEDRFSLAKLYDADRQWDKAEALYRAVIAADPKNPGPLSYFTRRLLQLDKTDLAADPLGRLEKLIPDSAMAVTLRGRYLFQRGEVETLVYHLSGYVGRAKANTPDPFERMFVAGSLLDEFAHSTLQPSNQPGSAKRLFGAAIEMYQKCIQTKPDAVVRAAALHSHFGNLEVALKWLDQNPFPKNLKASAKLAALRSAHADARQCAETEKWLIQEAQKDPTVDLVLHLADVQEMKHNFVEAERLYREVLKAQPGNVVAMNNLAWVLAHRGPSPEALELVQRAVAVAGPLADLLDTRAKVYLSLGRSAEAIQDLEDAINEAPTAMRYFQLALAEERHANPAAAKSAFALARRYGIDARDLHPEDAKMFERMSKS